MTYNSELKQTGNVAALDVALANDSVTDVSEMSPIAANESRFGLASVSFEADFLAQPCEFYPGQFATTPDPLYIALPRTVIVDRMQECGEAAAVDQVCLCVAIVVDAIEQARQNSLA